MATYEYRCLPCDDTFELSRPMADADAPAPCPAGHVDTKRLLSVFAATSGGRAAPGPSTGGGCCGGACGCG